MSRMLCFAIVLLSGYFMRICDIAPETKRISPCISILQTHIEQKYVKGNEQADINKHQFDSFTFELPVVFFGKTRELACAKKYNYSGCLLASLRERIAGTNIRVVTNTRCPSKSLHPPLPHLGREVVSLLPGLFLLELAPEYISFLNINY